MRIKSKRIIMGKLSCEPHLPHMISGQILNELIWTIIVWFKPHLPHMISGQILNELIWTIIVWFKPHLTNHACVI